MNTSVKQILLIIGTHFISASFVCLFVYVFYLQEVTKCSASGMEQMSARTQKLVPSFGTGLLSVPVFLIRFLIIVIINSSENIYISYYILYYTFIYVMEKYQTIYA